jgi:hypothetical protein
MDLFINTFLNPLIQIGPFTPKPDEDYVGRGDWQGTRVASQFVPLVNITQPISRKPINLNRPYNFWKIVRMNPCRCGWVIPGQQAM